MRRTFISAKTDGASEVFWERCAHKARVARACRGSDKCLLRSAGSHMLWPMPL